METWIDEKVCALLSARLVVNDRMLMNDRLSSVGTPVVCQINPSVFFHGV